MSIASEITRIHEAKADLKAAINAQGGTLTDETVDDYAAAVAALPVHDLSAVTVTASDILSGKVAVDPSGTQITGNIPMVSPSTSGNVVSVPSGYIASAQTVTVGTAKAAQTYTPGTADQTIASGTYLAGAQTIKGDAHLVAGNIKGGVSIFGIAGSYSGTDVSGVTAAASDVTSGTKFVTSAGVLTDGTLAVVTQPAPSVSIDSATGLVTASYTPVSGRVNDTSALSGTLQLSAQSSASITPGTSSVTAVAAGKYTIGAVTVAGDSNLVAGNIKGGVTIFGVTGTASASGTDTSDADAAAGDILAGKTAYVNGAKISGTISSLSAATITPTTSAQVISAGVFLSGDQTIAGDSNLVSSNIASGVSIFGVAGTMSGSTDFYKCASVTAGGSAWTGHRAVLSNGVYSFASSVTGGLTYGSGFTPAIGKVYDAPAMMQVKLNTGEIPLNGLIASAMPDPGWTSGQSLMKWDDFIQPDVSKRPQIATISGVTGVKAQSGRELTALISPITGDFSYAIKFYFPGDSSGITILNDNTWNGAVSGINGSQFILSKQGVSSVQVSLTLTAGVHTAVVTYQSSGSASFYIDGVSAGTESYSPDFQHSNTLYYGQVDTSDNLILGLAVYGRVLTAAEVAAIAW